MSLVNDMLNDLDKRRLQQPAQSENLDWLTGQSNTKPITRRSLYAAMLVIVLAVGGILVFTQYRTEPVAVSADISLNKTAGESAGLDDKIVPPRLSDTAPVSLPKISTMSLKSVANGLQIKLQATGDFNYQLKQNSRQIELLLNKVSAQLPAQTGALNAPVKAVFFQPNENGLTVVFQLLAAVDLQEQLAEDNQLLLTFSAKVTDDKLPVKPSIIVIDGSATASTNSPQSKEIVSTVAKKPTAMKTMTPLTMAQQDAALVKEVAAMIRVGNLPLAEQRLAEFVQRYPEAAKANALLIELLVNQGLVARAQARLQALPVSVTMLSDIRRLQAHVLVLEKQPNQAVELLLTTQPDIKSETKYYELLAMAAQRAKQYPLSIQVYKSLLRFDSGQGQWWLGLAISEELSGLKADARGDFLQAMRAGRLEQSLREYARNRYEALAGAVNVYPQQSEEAVHGG